MIRRESGWGRNVLDVSNTSAFTQTISERYFQEIIKKYKKTCKMLSLHTMQSNMSESEYLTHVLGPRFLPLDVIIPLTTIYAIIFFLGIIGNLATCLVIIKNSFLQSVTNFYLFSLAISDVTLLLLGLPNELSVFWQQYPWVLGLGLCKFRAYLSEM
ncbi:neuropeptides capa receptor-like [Copidosoma floridanum]|uniref:neuropeptides capa receptor-like n=1 Tax=Copidosoma floridanum TaxID=29053 RepID=UPI000C6F72C9|nr:neuropeptides capa receptor-like [Copidosoma floridanum]